MLTAGYYNPSLALSYFSTNSFILFSEVEDGRFGKQSFYAVMTVICRCDASGNQEDPEPASKRVDDVKCRECSGPATRGECHSVTVLEIRRATQ